MLNGAIGFVLGAFVALVLLALLRHAALKRRKVQVGYWVYVKAPTFEKSIPYRVMELTKTRAFVSMDGHGLSGRWVPLRHLKPSTKDDPYEK